MEGCQYIFHNQSFIKDDRVLVVVTFPSHEADHQVFTQSNFTVICGRTVSQNFTSLYMFTMANNRSLVDASTLVGTFEFQQFVSINTFTVISSDFNAISINELDSTCMFSQLHNTGVFCSSVFHTCTYHRCFCYQQRYCLSLHVGTHQRTVGVVVFQEWDHCCRNGYYLFWRYVHIVDTFSWYNVDFTAHATGRNFSVYKVAFRIQRFVGLCYDLIFFVICSQVLNFVSYSACFFIYYSIWSFDKSIFVDDSVCCQGTDQTDVWTFRSFDRTHSTVVGVVYVSNFEASSLSGQTARSQSRQSSLVSQFCQWVCLVHKLGQLGTSEEFLNRSCYRTNVHQRLWSRDFDILRSHSFFNCSFHSSKTDTELVLQQFTYSSQSSVTQVVDIINCTDTIVQVQNVGNRRNDICNQNVLWRQLILSCCHCFQNSFFILSFVFVQDFFQNREIYLVSNLVCCKVSLDVFTCIYELVTDYFCNSFFIITICKNVVYTSCFNCMCQLNADYLACLCQDFTCSRISNVFCQLNARNTAA